MLQPPFTEAQQKQWSTNARCQASAKA